MTLASACSGCHCFMNGPWTLILPLSAALLYAAAAPSLKRAAELGAGLWHSAFVSNLLTALAFQGLLLLGGRWQPLAPWWQPLVTAVLFLSGQVWTLVSLQRGDALHCHPGPRTKIIRVASFTTLLLWQGLSWRLWLAAALSTCGIACLNHSGALGGSQRHRDDPHAGVAAASFSRSSTSWSRNGRPPGASGGSCR